MIILSNISLQFSGQPILEDVTLQIGDNDKIGLVGRNGAGKSTLLKILVGIHKPDSGNISMPQGTEIGYLAQEVNMTGDQTVLEEARKAFEPILKLERRLGELQKKLTEGDTSEKVLEEFSSLQHRHELMEGVQLDERCERILKGLGFEQSDFERKVSEFSGGWQMRIELAKILLQAPSIILLDEPTNHLDIESITWLEGFLKNYEGSVMIVSHDRTFLDNITNRTVEVAFGKLENYKVSYTKYMELRAERKEKQIAAKKNQDKYIAGLERNIERFRAKKNKAKFAQTLIRKVEKMERIEVDEDDIRAMKIRFPEPPRSGKIVLKVKKVNKSYGDNHVIRDFTCTIEKGEHVAFVGKNGMGKTTLSRMIIGDLEHTGDLELGNNVSIGYYAQHQAESLDGNRTIFETIDDVATGEMRSRVRGLLGAFLFSGEDVDKKVKVLSGGEKSRLALCKLLLEPVNLLVLDEPTHHLDMLSKDILKEALLNFGGTLILVSHDRDFLTGLTQKVFEFRKGKINEHFGGIDDFLNSRNMDSFRQLELSQIQNKQTPKEPEQNDGLSNKERYAKKKEHEKQLRKAKNQLAKSETRITDLEREIAAIEERLRDPEEYKKVMSDTAFFESYESLKEDLEREMENWESLGEEVDALRQEVPE